LDLTYVFNRTDLPPGDVMPYVIADFDAEAAHIELPGLTPRELAKLPWETPQVEHREPKVPFNAIPWPRFESPAPPEFISLTRSPAYTPAESDALYDAIRERFIDECFS
jgi:hypothetical protein